jgi:hypothetical protein
VGAWSEAEVPWYETRIVNCVFCGKMIPRRVWLATHGGRELAFCGPACEERYVRYWLPRYGESRAAGEIGEP